MVVWQTHDQFCHLDVGYWYGGLGLAGVLACACLPLSGSSPATVVAIGSISSLPAMVKAGFRTVLVPG